MKTIETIQQLLDEIPVISEISKDLPFPYCVVINQKIEEFTNYLEEIHSQEIEKNNGLQSLASDLLNELESQLYNQSKQ